MAGKQWGSWKEKEEQERRKLLSRARSGDRKAQEHLMQKYGMRVYSDTERSNMPTYYDSGKKGSPPSLAFTSTSAPTPANQSPKANAKKRAESMAKPKKKKLTV